MGGWMDGWMDGRQSREMHVFKHAGEAASKAALCGLSARVFARRVQKSPVSRMLGFTSLKLPRISSMDNFFSL